VGPVTWPPARRESQGAEHLTPSDAVWLAKGGIKTGPMGPEKTIAAIRSYVAAFLDAESSRHTD